MATTHSVRETNGGRFEVDYGWGGRRATFDTLIEAESEVRRSTAEQDGRAAESERIATKRLRFVDYNPALKQRQLEWQAWRGEEYDRRFHNARRASREALHHAGDRKSGVTAQRALEAAAELSDYHTRISSADTATKRAINAGDATTWEEALDKCEQIMRAAR